MEKYILPGLVANASTLGIHWIYDYKYLEELSKQKSLLFLRQEKEHFEQAKPSFYSYPNSEIGDLTVQGQIIKWLYQAMESNKEFSKKDYSKLLYEKFKPGGSYTGYVETYSKKHVVTFLAKSLHIDTPKIPVMDNHLVGFAPYLVCKELGLDNKKAWELTTVYSQDEDYLIYFNMFDSLFDLLRKGSMHEAVKSVIHLGPVKYQIPLNKAIEMDNTNEFIKQYSGRACEIQYSIPLIMHILSHTNSYQEAVELNATIGGAVSDRNLLVGALYAQVSEIPEAWVTLVKEKIIL